jgi:hypothetical protein
MCRPGTAAVRVAVVLTAVCCMRVLKYCDIWLNIQLNTCIWCCSLCITLRSKPRDAPAAAAPVGASAAPTAVPGKPAAATTARPPTAKAQAADAGTLPAAPHVLNVRLSGLPGVEQELTTVPGYTQQLGPQ